VRRVLGVDARMHGWPARAARVPWLAPIARASRGVRPPRYPTLFEAALNAVIFQQISIHAAGAIMRRFVEACGTAMRCGEVTLVSFPLPGAVAKRSDADLRALGLSANKCAHVRSIADAVGSGAISDAEIEALPTPEASERLCSLRGIGPWSAAVILLRGFGRLDTFPMNDSGVAASVNRLTGGPPANLEEVLQVLGPVRGLLYYHLLLSRNLGASSGD
jgi:DNA-3-methyladenine glycosylase II